MCIVLLTTAHPSYALIVIDNRDEFILRPTSRPHWWSHPSGPKVLSPRDLQRAEKGTWLGFTSTGSFAVLTNYREDGPPDAEHPIHAQRSRGGMVTAWLGADPAEPTAETVQKLVADGGVRGVGGFSMVAGKLRRKKGEERALEGIAIVSNRCGHVHDVPWIGEERGEVYGLSNTSYHDPETWPKVAEGKRLVKEAVEEAVAKGLDEEALAEKLFGVLDTDTLPPPRPGQGFAEYIPQLKHSIFIPSIGDEHHQEAMVEATKKGKGEWDTDDKKAAEQLQRPEATPGANGIGFDTGMYGTQRQSVILVDWDGNVVFRERALWDSNGNPIAKGEGDIIFKYKIEGWEN
ncbi:hypothetical protein ACHAQH_005668 [Verticillium albo-atrum]